MNTTLAQQVNAVLKSRTSCQKKADLLVKLGVTPFEAMVLAKSATMPSRPRVEHFNFTFGVEIETVCCETETFKELCAQRHLAVIDHLNCYDGCHNDIPHFKLVPDGSLSGFHPAECVTPALDNNRQGFASLEACCKSLVEAGASVNKSCGLHVHIGAAALTEQEYCNVFLNYQRLEKAIDSFMAESRRADRSRWCHTLADHNLYGCSTRDEVYRELNCDRYHKVNPCAWGRHKTIEFRQHQGTVNYDKIKSWVLFLGKLVNFSRTNRLTASIDRIEDIPFLTKTEKDFFIRRRMFLAAS